MSQIIQQKRETLWFQSIGITCCSLRGIQRNILSFEDADKEQSKLFKTLNNMKKDKGSVEKKYFLKYVGLFLNAREEALNSFKSNVCPIKMLDKLDKILTLKTNYP